MSLVPLLVRCLSAGIAVFTFFAAPAARAQLVGVLQSLYSFGDNGSYPVVGLAVGQDGNFYGATSNGGSANGDGTVFRITSGGSLSVVYNFGGADGSQPYAGLLADADGNLYGSTGSGGDANGDGTIFRVSPVGDVVVLHAFNGADGSQPQAGLVRGGDGNLYGATTYGGSGGSGTIFSLTSSGTLTTLYSFTGGTDGAYPVAGLVQAADGNLYGTTSDGGNPNGNGTIFCISTGGKLTTLHAFNGNDGYQPTGQLIAGSDGNLYGTTVNGGANGSGTVFKTSTAGVLTTVYNFSGGNDGAYPYAGLLLGADGNLYGTTSAGGNPTGDGTVFQVTPAGALTTLCVFTGSDGSQPQTALVAGSDGNLYGTTSAGGASGQGTVFKVTVATVAPFFAGQVSLGSNSYYLAFTGGNYFGYYAFVSDVHYVYHYDFGWQYVFDAADGHSGVYLYDFQSSDFFYTSPDFPFPYLYDFGLNSVIYYFPDANNAGRYTTQPRYFYDFVTGAIITK